MPEALTLQQGEAFFQQNNRELQTAQRAMDGADADVITAVARPNPNLSISIIPSIAGTSYPASRTRRWHVVGGRTSVARVSETRPWRNPCRADR
jgi:hypothetical protein